MGPTVIRKTHPLKMNITQINRKVALAFQGISKKLSQAQSNLQAEINPNKNPDFNFVKISEDDNFDNIESG